MKPWWWLTVCFCSHYQGQLGMLLNYFRTFSTKIKGFCLFWCQRLYVVRYPVLVWALDSKVFNSWEFIRFSQAAALPPADPQLFWPVWEPLVHALPLCAPGRGGILGPFIYADTGYLFEYGKLKCSMFSLLFCFVVEMNSLKYVVFGIVSPSCNFTTVSLGWIQWQEQETILSYPERDLMEGSECWQTAERLGVCAPAGHRESALSTLPSWPASSLVAFATINECPASNASQGEAFWRTQNVLK